MSTNYQQQMLQEAEESIDQFDPVEAVLTGVDVVVSLGVIGVVSWVFQDWVGQILSGGIALWAS